MALPGFLQKVIKKYPRVWAKYAEFGEAIGEVEGGLDAKTRELIKLAAAASAGSEGAVHSHTKRALEEGATSEEVFHALLLTAPTTGWPRAVAALSWADDVLGEIKAL